MRMSACDLGPPSWFAPLPFCLPLPAASYFPEFKEAAIKMIEAQGGIVGWTADTAAVEAALTAMPNP